MYPISISPDAGVAQHRIVDVFRRLRAKLAAAATAAAERRDTELPREYFRFPPF